MYTVRCDFTFAAAHRLPLYEGDCKKLHGHTYKLQVAVSKEELNEQGMVIDFRDLSEIVEEKVIDKLDHSYLNDMIENPTAENIAKWAYDKLKELNPDYVEVGESEKASVRYTP